MQTKLPYENFDLTKVKLIKDGLAINYHEKGGAHDSYVVECEGLPHPDLIKALDALKPYCAKLLQLTQGWTYAREHLQSNLDLYEVAMKSEEEQNERFKVSGIVFVGSEQLSGIKVTGSLKVANGSIGMATTNVTFASEKLGYEKIVEELAEVVKAETYSYLFKNKRAQQDLMTQAQENDDQQDDGVLKTNTEKPEKAKKVK